jgi:hypothetical protein
MAMSNDHEAAPRATRRRNLKVPAVAGLILACLCSGPATARGEERRTPQASSTAAQPAGPASARAATSRKESPYSRYAREHAMNAQKKQGRVKATHSTAHGSHKAARGGR